MGVKNIWALKTRVIAMTARDCLLVLSKFEDLLIVVWVWGIVEPEIY
jgi:hypothetical protein